jgi:hypothetical protein
MIVYRNFQGQGSRGMGPILLSRAGRQRADIPALGSRKFSSPELVSSHSAHVGRFVCVRRSRSASPNFLSAQKNIGFSHLRTGTIFGHQA